MSIAKPEYHNIEEFINRSSKLDEIRKLGMEPYPHKFAPEVHAKELEERFKDKTLGHSEEAAAGNTEEFKMAGRLVLFRAMGKNAFAQIQDSTGRFQVMFNRDLTKVDGYTPDGEDSKPLKFIEKKLDLGDIVGIEGHLFRTQKGEITIFVKKLKLLCKTLLPLPDKHSGLTDKGVRYRKRWLDLICNPESKDKLIMRSLIIKEIRHYFEENHFIEVETPILQNIYGGAQAKPFKSMLNALHQEMFLRISLEIQLKKLLVGGIDRVFEIGKVFRNEGIDRTHNPEFTLLEAYAAYWDYNDLMILLENLFERLAIKFTGSAKVQIGEHLVDFKAPWKRLSMIDSIKEYAGIDIDILTTDEIKNILLTKTHVDPAGLKNVTRGGMIAILFEELVEKHLIQPHHIIDHPIETTPLCKLHRNPDERKKGLVERFESFVLGGEACNAYSELNDPVLQRELLEDQAAKKEAGDEEANPFDEEFVEAICQGMPPAAGIGIGIDRLIMFITNSASIRDVLFFPLMKPGDL